MSIIRKLVVFLLLLSVSIVNVSAETTEADDTLSHQNERFKAYYTRLDGGEEWEKHFRAGPHADVVVSFPNSGRFTFGKATSYLPKWESGNGFAYVNQAPFEFSGDGDGLRWDELCRHSHVRIIEASEDTAVIHWRYAPVFSTDHNAHAPSMENVHFELTPNWEGWVDEYYTIKSDQTIIREIYHHDSGINYIYKYDLNDNGSIEEIASGRMSFKRSAPSFSTSETLPSGPDLSFGASYTKLGYSGDYFRNLAPSGNWNDNWQVGDHPDIVVNFDDSSSKWVFWRGTNFVAHMVSENDVWYTNEFNETWNLPGMISFGAEPMNDKSNRYAHARIIENSDARVVVHMRYALCDEGYNLVSANDDPYGWTDFSDFYYTIYPDGTVVQHNTLWSGWAADEPSEYEWQEAIVVHGPGRTPMDNIEVEETISLGNLEGDFMDISYSDLDEDIPDPYNEIPESLSIQRINLKGSDEDPFLIVESGEDTEMWLAAHYDGENYDMPFDWWNHWPINMHHSFGELALDARHASHTSLTGIYDWPVYNSGENYSSKILLTGMKDLSDEELLMLAHSWENAPTLNAIKGIESYEYVKSERAYKVYLSSSDISFKLMASSEQPLYNPVIIVKDWGDVNTANIQVNTGDDASEVEMKQGIALDMDGNEMLIIWMDLITDMVTEVKIAR